MCDGGEDAIRRDKRSCIKTIKDKYCCDNGWRNERIKKIMRLEREDERESNDY